MTQQTPDPAAIRAALDRLADETAGVILQRLEYGRADPDHVDRYNSRVDAIEATFPALIAVARAAEAEYAARDRIEANTDTAFDTVWALFDEFDAACKGVRAALAALAAALAAAVPGAGDGGG